MVLDVFIVAVVILALAMVLFFLFSVLLPAMKNASFSVDAPLFAESELTGEGKAYSNSKNANVGVSDKRAFVACGACVQCDEDTFVFDRTHSCRTVHEVCLSLSDCTSMCIGSGDCAAACPQCAIVVKNHGKRSFAVVTDLCCGCGKCVEVCPQNVIKMIPKGDVASLCAEEKQEIDVKRPSVFGFLRGGV